MAHDPLRFTVGSLVAGAESVGAGGTATTLTVTAGLEMLTSVDTGSTSVAERTCRPAESVTASDQVPLLAVIFTLPRSVVPS